MRVSVIMPCYNAADWIGVALRSLLNQTVLPHEIIVVDDGSDDESAEIAESFGAPVRVLRVPNGGAARARKTGVAEASGDALMFMDADDLIAPDSLAALAGCLSAHPGQIALTPWYRYEQVNGAVWLPRPASCPPRRPEHDDLQAWLSGWYHPPCAVLWSRAAYERSGGWDEDLAVNQDGDIMMRGLVRGNRLVLTRTGAAFYRRLPVETATVSGGRSTRKGVQSRLRVLDRITGMLEEEHRTPFYANELRLAYKDVKDSCPSEFGDLRTWADGALYALPRRRAAKARSAGLPICDQTIRPSADTLPRPSLATSPAVSVVIPTWNRAEIALRAVNSVLEQSFRDLELIVVDDASTDDTVERLRAVTDTRLRIVRQSVNQGVAAARNRGLAEARAPLVAFLDSDDLWRPDKLERQVAAMQAASPRVGILYCGIENRAPDTRDRWTPVARGPVFETMLEKNLLHGLPSTGLFRREVFDMVGGFDTSFPAIEDFEMWLRITRFWEVDFVPETLASYYDGKDTDTAGLRRSRNLVANNAARDMFHQRYARDMRAASVEHEFLLESARRRAEEGGLARWRAARSVLKAIRYRPQASKLYAWLPLILMKPQLRDRIVDRIRALRHPAAFERPDKSADAN